MEGEEYPPFANTETFTALEVDSSLLEVATFPFPFLFPVSLRSRDGFEKDFPITLNFFPSFESLNFLTVRVKYLSKYQFSIS